MIIDSCCLIHVLNYDRIPQPSQCEYDNERLTVDEHDAWPGDFNLTLTCKPNKNFNFPDVAFKDACKSWQVSR